MIFGNAMEVATSVQAVLAAVATALCGVLVYVFKVWMPKVLQDNRDDSRTMIGHLLTEAATNRTFISVEMAKRDAVLEKLADRVSDLNDRIELCPHRSPPHA